MSYGKRSTTEKYIEKAINKHGLVSGRAILEKIKTKLLGGIPIVNDQVLHATEEWFNKNIPEIEQYLIDGPSRFWRIIKETL